MSRCAVRIAGAENLAGKKFCRDCGAPLEYRFQCGAENPAGKCFCSDCGTALTNNGPATQSSASSQSTADIQSTADPTGASLTAELGRRRILAD
jgi:hypothetical protein